MGYTIKFSSDFFVVLIHFITNLVFMVLGCFLNDIFPIPVYLSAIMGVYAGMSIITLPLLILYLAT